MYHLRLTEKDKFGRTNELLWNQFHNLIKDGAELEKKLKENIEKLKEFKYLTCDLHNKDSQIDLKDIILMIKKIRNQKIEFYETKSLRIPYIGDGREILCKCCIPEVYPEYIDIIPHELCITNIHEEKGFLIQESEMTSQQYQQELDQIGDDIIEANRRINSINNPFSIFGLLTNLSSNDIAFNLDPKSWIPKYP